MFELVIPTGEGEFTAGYTAKGLAEMSFPKSSSRMRERAPIPPELRRQITDWHRLTTKALKMILTGRKPTALPPLDITGTKFQREVWRGMLEIPWGKTSSYGELARRIGRPKAVRALGGACGSNSIPVFIPCHRVLAAHGKLGGFTSGLRWKRKLLGAEGAWDS